MKRPEWLRLRPTARGDWAFIRRWTVVLAPPVRFPPLSRLYGCGDPEGWADSESAPVLPDENGPGNQACRPRTPWHSPGRREAQETKRWYPSGPTVTLPSAAVVCVLVVASMAATPGVAVGESLAATAAQDSSAVEASLALDRSRHTAAITAPKRRDADHAGRTTRAVSHRMDRPAPASPFERRGAPVRRWLGRTREERTSGACLWSLFGHDSSRE